MADIKWIKITTDIFDDEKILLIEALPDADAVLVIWLKLLCLAGKQNNSGVFIMNDKIAYTDEMLATIFRRPINTVRLALDTFERFGMIDLIDGVITIPNWEKHQNIDALEKIREQSRVSSAKYREKQKLLKSDITSDITVTECDQTDKKRKDKKREDKNRIYYPEDEYLNQIFSDYVEMRKKIKAPMTERAINLAITKLDELSSGDRNMAIEIVNQSILNSWRGLFPLKGSNNNNQSYNQPINWEEV